MALMHVHKNFKLKLKPNGQIRNYQVQIISTSLVKQQLRSLGDIPSRCQHWGSYIKLLSENERNPSMAWWTAILSVCYFNTTQQMVVLGNARMWVCACMPMLVWEAYIYIITSHCAVAKYISEKHRVIENWPDYYLKNYFMEMVNKCQTILIADYMANVVLHLLIQMK